MEKAYLGFEHFVQMEFLWHMKMARNNYALSAAGGNVFWLNGDFPLGTVIRHTGGAGCEVGFDETGIFTYGVVIDRDTELNQILVKIIGECRVKCSEFAQVGQYAEAQEDGSIKPRWLDKIINPQAVIGVCSGKTAGGFCKVVLGPGRECSQTSPISGNFLWQANKLGGHSLFAAATIILPNAKVVGPFCSGFKQDCVIDNKNRIVAHFEDEFFKQPPMVFSSVVNTRELYQTSVVSETDKLTFSFFRGGEMIKPQEINDAQLNVICMGVTE